MNLTTAEEWIPKLKFCPCHQCNRVESIKQIQADALRWVVDHCRLVAERHINEGNEDLAFENAHIAEVFEIQANQLHPLREEKEQTV